LRIHGDAEQVPVKKGHTSGIKVTRLLRELSDDKMDDNDNNTPVPSSPSAPTSSQVDPRKIWLHDFNYYVNTFDQLAENQSIVQWWGVCIPYLFTQQEY
jgi:hypothetical protein